MFANVPIDMARALEKADLEYSGPLWAGILWVGAMSWVVVSFLCIDMS